MDKREQTLKTLKVQFWLFILLYVIGDTFSTYWGLSSGGVESNPIVLMILPNWTLFILLKLFMTGFSILILSAIYKHYKAISLVTITFVNVALVIIVLGNFRII
jgi:hypothetical protein